MSFPPKSDLWHVGMLPASFATFLCPASLPALRDRIVWLPDPGPWRYLADPFGVRRGDTTHVFVEAYDYRTKHAVIEHHAFDSALCWQSKDVALTQPVHLSYPYLLEHDGETFMMPESCRAGEVALYRARSFPLGWEKEAVLLCNIRAADATPVVHDGRWWLFFTLVGERGRDRRELHAAYADTFERIFGTPHDRDLTALLAAHRVATAQVDDSAGLSRALGPAPGVNAVVVRGLHR